MSNFVAMNCVIENIEYLVRRHDCVVIPSIGALIARREHAYYDESAMTFKAPRRHILFNPGIVKADGLLAASIARKAGIPFLKASRIVDEEVAQMKRQLQSDGEISLGTLGRLVNQPMPLTPIFEASDRLIRESAAGFADCKVSPAQFSVKREPSALKIVPKKQRGRLRRVGVRALKVAASVAVALGIGLALSAPALIDRSDNLASVTSADIFAPKSMQTAMLPHPQSEALVLSIAIPAAESQEALADNDKPSQGNQSVSDSAQMKIREDGTPRFCLVVASLTSRAQAEKFIAEDGADGLQILEKDGKFRVYVATGATSESTYARKSTGDFATRYPDAWVCRMN